MEVKHKNYLELITFLPMFVPRKVIYVIVSLFYASVVVILENIGFFCKL